MSRPATKSLAELRTALANEDWNSAAAVLEDSWAFLVGNHIDKVRDALVAFPESVIEAKPVLRAGRELIVGWGASARFPGPLPARVDELMDLGGSARAADVLVIGTVQACLLRFSGMFTQAAELTHRVERVASSAVSAQPDVVAAAVPILRLQWAITCQLAGRHQDAITLLRLAYAGARAVGIDFVVRNAAGSLAMSHALSGDLPAARKWLTLWEQTDPGAAALEPRVRVSGLVARMLIALEELDLPAAREASDTLGELGDNEELWAYALFARAQYGLLSGYAQEAIDRVEQLAAVNARWCTPGSDADALLRSVSIDLHCALGRGNNARTALNGRSDAHPLVAVSQARLELLTGSEAAALTTSVRITAAAGGDDQRALVDALLVQAAASIRLGSESAAVEACRRAMVQARTNGALRPFALLPPAVAKELAAAGAPFPRGWAESGYADGAAVFPDTVALVDLTNREQVVLAALANGLPLQGIAADLFVSQNTVKSQVRSLFRKLDVHSRDEAVRVAAVLRLL
ncbi:LuxR C-terminal-related transcriptional regulator [Prescottella soli]|uniref:LuxR C-terminal-related transcriptional regulator n=1 Tax=Prescottella soli TaxID=1543852 RepID=A0ABW9G1K8_9NOCA